MLINYDWFLKEAQSISSTTFSTAKYIEEFMAGKDVAYIYPKKFIRSTSAGEWDIFIITSTGVYLFQPIEEDHRLKEISMICYSLNEISSVTLSAPRDLRRAKLDIQLRNGEHVEFDSLEDSTEEWTDEYAKVIYNIAKYITK